MSKTVFLLLTALWCVTGVTGVTGSQPVASAAKKKKTVKIATPRRKPGQTRKKKTPTANTLTNRTGATKKAATKKHATKKPATKKPAAKKPAMKAPRGVGTAKLSLSNARDRALAALAEADLAAADPTDPTLAERIVAIAFESIPASAPPARVRRLEAEIPDITDDGPLDPEVHTAADLVEYVLAEAVSFSILAE